MQKKVWKTGTQKTPTHPGTGSVNPLKQAERQHETRQSPKHALACLSARWRICNLKTQPLPPAPLLISWLMIPGWMILFNPLTVHMDHFSLTNLYLEALGPPVWYLVGLNFIPWVTMLAIKGSTRTAQRTSWVPGFVFNCFWCMLGSVRGHYLITLLKFVVSQWFERFQFVCQFWGVFFCKFG